MNRSQNARKLTQAAIAKLRAPATGRTIFWDSYLPGFGLRVTSNGSRAWMVVYRVNRKLIWETIGSLAKMPNVGDARDAARQSMVKAMKGIDPQAERRQQRQQEAEQEDAAGKRKVGNIVEEYFQRYVAVKQQPRTAKETKRLFDRDTLPVLNKRHNTAIKQADIQRMIDDAGERGPSAANTLHMNLTTFFKWSQRRG